MKTPRNFRSRPRADGSLRVWWEPRAAERKLGFAPVELDADRMGWSIKEAEKLNKAAQAAAEGGGAQPVTAQRHGRTITDLIGAYRTSVHFGENLRPKTRDSYRKLMLVIDDKWGTRRASEFDKATMHTWYQALYKARGARMAQALIRMFSILMEHAETMGWRPGNSNPCLRLKLVTPKARGRVATMDELTAVLASAEALGLHGVRLAVLLSLLQGQRQTDVLGARRDAFQLAPYLAPGEDVVQMRLAWSFVRSKRGNAGMMVVNAQALPYLRAALAETGTAARPLLPADPLIRDEATGKPYTAFLFNKRWHAVLAHAADPAKGNCPTVTDLQFRDLRRTFGVLARKAGLSKDDIGDVLGNSVAVNPQLGEVYTPASFETASRAVTAVQMAPKKGTRE